MALAVVVVLTVVCLIRPAMAEEHWPASLKGRLLIASTELDSPIFAKTIIYMVEHDKNGAMGLIVNRPLGEMPTSELRKALNLDATPDEVPSLTLRFGGPVERDLMFVLHSDDMKVESSRAVDHDLALTSDPELLRAIVAGEGPSRYAIAMGYSGWAAGQLEAEIKRGSWEWIDYDLELVMAPEDDAWDRAIGRVKIDL
ncbi:MAG: YqgE/AlgH family protein [Alphaproteobacteria bacterium]|nr:YqgE/AlgH family protein [Alphaproteobacteria bacterium]